MQQGRVLWGFRDSTFTQQHSERAHATGHSTARQAAETAKIAGVGGLWLWHFSQRYPNVETHLAEAREVFAATEASRDGLGVEVTRQAD